MSYAIKVLKDERDLIKDCLSKWDEKKYPEARKVRDKRLKELNNAIELLEK